MENATIIEIAYADDHTTVREGISNIISSDVIKVTIQAGNGKELIQKLSQAAALPHLCIIDIQMPVMNGYETVLAIKQRWPHLRILVFTAFAQEYNILTMIQYGVNGYLTKDCHPAEIKKAIISINEYGVYYSHIASGKLFQAIRNKEIKIPNLTERELLLLRLIASNKTYAEIARELKISLSSVQGYRDSIYNKFDIHDRAALSFFTYQLGILSSTRSEQYL